MKQLITYLFLTIACFTLSNKQLFAQPGVNDTILVNAVIIDGDTLPYFYLSPTDIRAFIGSAARKTELDRLRYNVYKVYPYALSAASILQKIDNDLGINARRRDKKAYLKALDKELNTKYKDELKDLTITQGQILVKLINRETGRDVYSLIKELKGGFNARIYQTAFGFFDNNLKTQYAPYGADKDIEMIVSELEKRYTQHAVQLQTKPKEKNK